MRKKTLYHPAQLAIILLLTLVVFWVSQWLQLGRRQQQHTKAATVSFPTAVTLDLHASPKPVSANIWGVNFDYVGFATVSDFYNFFGKTTFANMGIKQIRIGGCNIDAYNWREKTVHYLDRKGREILQKALGPEEILTIAEENGMSVLWGINMETKALPNPCGRTPLYPGLNMTESQRKAILLQDAKDLLTLYKGRIKYFEMGNESWGAWNPVDYINTAKEFAQALKNIDPTIHISLQGHPTSGNNQDPDIPIIPPDTAWTDAVKNALNANCGSSKCFDSVTDHPYTNSGYDPNAQNFNWNVPGLGSFFAASQWDWIFGKRLVDYAPKQLAITEWNQICWGKPNQLVVTEPSFEGSTANSVWNFWTKYPNLGENAIVTETSHTGNKSLRVTLQTPSGNQQDQIETYQNLNIPKSNYIQVYAWVKTTKPLHAEIVLQQANAGTNQGQAIAYENFSHIPADTWVPVMAIGKPFADTTQVRIGLRISKTSAQWQSDPSPVVVYFDDILFNSYPAAVLIPAITTVEQGLFAAETLLQMAKIGVSFGNYHSTSIGNCGLISAKNTLRSTGQVYQLTSVLAGGFILPTTVVSEKKNIPENQKCSNASCIRGPLEVNYVSAYSGLTADKGILYMFLINRHEKKETQVTLNGLPNLEAQLVLLTAGDYSKALFTESKQIVESTGSLKITLPPISIARLTFVLSCRIQGYKKAQNGTNDPRFSNQTVSLDNPASSTTTNPYYLSFKLTKSGQRTVSVTEPAGFKAGYTVCFNQINCHDETPVLGNQFTFTDNQVAEAIYSQKLASQCYVDLWWHYSPPASPSPCAKPTNISIVSSCTASGEVKLNCSWNSVSGATEYRGQIDDETTFSDPLLRNSLNSSTTRSITGVDPGQTYYCRSRVTQTSADCTIPGLWSNVASTFAPFCPTPPPVFTVDDLISLFINFLDNDDVNYFPQDNKVNILDAAWIIKWLK